jgi:SpoVK/Ycf46/Vps4 family AAA+-type ATPase
MQTGGGRSLPGWQPVRAGLLRMRQAIAAAPLSVRLALVVVTVLVFPAVFGILLIAMLCYAPVAVWLGRGSALASLSVSAWGVGVTLAVTAGGQPRGWLLALIALPVAAAGAAHLRSLARWHVPCRTVAWALAPAIPSGAVIWRFWPAQGLIGTGLGWLIAAAILGWRLASAWQAEREYLRQQARATAAVGHASLRPRVADDLGSGRAGATGRRDQRSRRGTRPWPAVPRPPAAGPRRAARQSPGVSVPRSSGAGERGVASGGFRAGAGAGMVPAEIAPAGRLFPDPAGDDGQQPHITVDEAMAELDAMIGLAAVKEQVRSIAASVEAARRRALAGFQAAKPMQHMVFLGPPGTGKTAVARIVAKIFYAFGLLDSPALVEAHRADLVGEYLGATAIKTNQLVDSALGGVLFIDEAYSLINEGDGQADRFGSEAVQALLKRAEDDRENLIIILAGYERQMDAFLAANPGLGSRFAIRVKFPGYSPAELLSLADLAIERRGELLDPDARPVLWRLLQDVGRRRLADELGNGRFVRSLLEKAGQARDVRVMAAGTEPSADDLVTLRAGDLETAYADLTTRFRGYHDTPTVEDALAELDSLVGLEPVKRQVREITAQLRVARLRDARGLSSQPPARHFVFTGPPGTGKTTVARILGRIFAALGLLVRPAVVEAHRGDLVGEHLGATSIKTNKLVDSALGGVLFIDEAYSLHNEGYAGGDAFGAEATAALLKRAEDDRDRLVIVLAGYTADMDRFLHSNPGLSSRFSVRIGFPSYTAAELTEIAQVIAARTGEAFEPQARGVLSEIFGAACADGRIDDLGNGRFARSLVERSCAARDVRIAHLGESATPTELTTVTVADVLAAYQDLRTG